MDARNKLKASSLYSAAVLLLVAGLLLPFSVLQPKVANATTLPAYRYTKTFDTTNGWAYSTKVATDSTGNVYLTGGFEGTVIFDGAGGSDSQTSSSSSVFLTKYNANGTYGWTKTFDTSSGDAYVNSMTVDPTGNVYLTGFFDNTVTFDGAGGSDSQTDPHNVLDVFLTKYNANGTYGWTKIFDNSHGSADGYGMAADPSGNVYLTGFFTGTVTFDGVGGSDSQTDPGNSNDVFLTKYNANGTYGWTKIFDTSSSDSDAGAVALATDSTGNVYVVGSFVGTVTFDGVGGSDSQSNPSDDQADAFLTKYNANGTYGWTKIFDNSNVEFVEDNGVTTGPNGNIYVAGDFSGTVTFDGVGGSDSQTDAGNNDDSFLVEYRPDGSYGWTRTFDTTNGLASAVSVATNSEGNVYLAGHFSGTVVFDDTGGSDSQTDAGGNGDGFLTEYNANGTYGWTRTFDTSAGDDAYAEVDGVAVDDNSNTLYVAGDFTGTITFDGTGGSDSQSDNNGGNGDASLTAYSLGSSSQSGPNNGDANDDGTPDSEQPYVSTVSDSLSGNYAVLQTSSACTNDSVSVSSEGANAKADGDFSYPAGLVNFAADCATPGYTATVSLYFYGLESSNLVLRKYNSSTKTYSTVPGATISQITIAGQKVTKATYHITDGSSLDQDGSANGTIVDPVGLAKASLTAPDTGYGSYTESPLNVLTHYGLFGGVLLVSALVFRRFRANLN